MKQKTLFRGIATALATPMTSSGAIDYDAYGRLIDWQIESGVAEVRRAKGTAAIAEPVGLGRAAEHAAVELAVAIQVLELVAVDGDDGLGSVAENRLRPLGVAVAAAAPAASDQRQGTADQTAA